MAVNKNIKNIIDRGHRGNVYFADSFKGVNEEYAGKILASMADSGFLLRVGQGIYVKPMQCEFGPFSPVIDDIVRAVARRDNANVLPSGMTALNKLGLSEQVPMNPVFITSGVARTLVIDGITITLKHVAPSNFKYRGSLIPLLVQALKVLGQDGIDEEAKEGICRLLAIHTDKHFEDDLDKAPVWMKKMIMKLNKESRQ